MTARSLNTVFFDLDGTLLDTAPDLYDALLRTLSDHQKPSVAFEEFRFHVYGGTNSMVKFGFEIDTDHHDFNSFREQFLDYYSHCNTAKTALFNGIEPLLQTIEQLDLAWGIITNKPGWLAHPICDHFGLTARSSCMIAGDTLARRKPHPDPLLHACEIAQCLPEQAIYVGDTRSDIVAAKAANMPSIAVTYGYHPRGDAPETWAADHLAHSGADILKAIKERL